MTTTQPPLTPPQVGFPASDAYLTAQVYNPLAWSYDHTPHTVWKATGTTITSSTTPVADPDLTIPLEAGATYSIDGALIATGAAIGTGDLKLALGFDGTLTWGAWTYLGIMTSGATAVASGGHGIGSTNTSVLGVAGGTFTPVRLAGTITTTTIGNLAAWWAQNTSSATGTMLRQGSWLSARRID